MSLPNKELIISKSFRELLEYVHDLGDHVNKIYNHVEKIEENINLIKDELKAAIISNSTEIEGIKEVTISKSEFNDVLLELIEPFENFSPPKTPEQVKVFKSFRGRINK